ncbi:MAG: peptidylprolyl isomerase [Candidatus Hermodarchaeota archaeon]
MTNIIMMTSKGDIKLKLFDEETPLAVSSFLFLAKQGFYNNIKFHRVIADFMIQGGDPLEAGYGGPKDKGINSFPYKGTQVSYPFKDEFESGRKFEKPGILAMANSGPNSNGSQFFITHVPTPWLNNNHTIFGEVISSNDQDIVNSIKQGDRIKEIVVLQ